MHNNCHASANTYVARSHPIPTHWVLFYLCCASFGRCTIFLYGDSMLRNSLLLFLSFGLIAFLCLLSFHLLNLLDGYVCVLCVIFFFLFDYSTWAQFCKSVSVGLVYILSFAIQYYFHLLKIHHRETGNKRERNIYIRGCCFFFFTNYC